MRVKRPTNERKETYYVMRVKRPTNLAVQRELVTKRLNSALTGP
jgi:hypothetical protein